MAMTPFARKAKMNELLDQIRRLEDEFDALQSHPDGHSCHTGFGCYQCVVCGRPAKEFEPLFDEDDDGN